MRKTLWFELYMVVISAITGYFWFTHQDVIGIYVLLGCAFLMLFLVRSIIFPAAPIAMIAFIESQPGVITSLSPYTYGALGVIILLALFIKKKTRKRSFLWSGLLFITIALMVSGTHALGTSYSWVMFCIGLALFFVYYLVYFSLQENDQYKIATLVKWIGVLITCQIGVYYFKDGNFLTLIQSKNLDIGWANTNPVGIALLATIPMTLYCYFAQKHNYLFNGMLFCGQVGAMILTYSRGAVLAMIFIMLIALVSFLFLTQKRFRIILLFGMVGICVATTVYLAKDNLTTIFDVTFRLGLDDNGRLELFQQALLVFKNNRLFGEGFNLSEFGVRSMTYYHSTPLQFMALMGSLGLIAWLVHIWNKYYVVLTHRNLLSFYGALAFLGVELYGLIDVTFFTFPYTMILILLLLMVESNRYYHKKSGNESSYFIEEVD